MNMWTSAVTQRVFFSQLCLHVAPTVQRPVGPKTKIRSVRPGVCVWRGWPTLVLTLADLLARSPEECVFQRNVLWKQIKATCLLYCCSFLFINIFYVSDFKININLLEKNWKVEERKFKYSHSSAIITIDTSGNFCSIVLFLNWNLVVVVVYLVAWVRSRDGTTMACFPLGAEGHQPPWGKMTSWSLPSFPAFLSCQGSSLTIWDQAQLEGKSYRHHIYNFQKGLLFDFFIDWFYLFGYAGP